MEPEASNRRTITLSFIVVLSVAGMLLLTTAGYLVTRWNVHGNDNELTIGDPYVIEILGSNKYWSAEYPDGLNRSPAVQPASDEIHLPLGTNIVLLLKSTDYVYTFSIPEMKLKEIAVPTLEFRIEFHPTEAAHFDLIGEPICGEPHSQTVGRLVVESREGFLDWRRSRIHAN